MSLKVGGRPSRALVRGAGAFALLAVVLAVLLPLAPVLVNEPTVRWPTDPSRPDSTLLTVTAYRPVEVDVRFSCRTARAAAQTDFRATVVSTVNPILPEVAHLGLIARMQRGELTVEAVGTRLVREPLPDGDCQYRVRGDAVSGLVLERDGMELGRGPAGVMPDVDLLVTSVASLPDATDADLAVTLRLDDEFATTPTGFKSVLTTLLVLALLAVALALAWLDRAVSRVPGQRRLPRPHPADAGVLLAMLGWLLLAPSTDDDGYYAAMAANSRESGFVGNYYQLYDQSFTPITWFYQLLAWWQTVAGTAPVAQRVLALTAGLLTWLVLRTLVSAALRHRGPGDPAAGPLVRMLAPGVAAVTFLAWWLPQNMGVRPEGAVALLTVAGLLAVWVAIRRQRLLAAWAACAAAGLALATHTTGFVGLAPLLAGAGGLWALVRVPRWGTVPAGVGGVGGVAGAGAAGGVAGLAGAAGAAGATGPGRERTDWERTAARALAVLSGGTTAALAGFADGSLRDFVRAQQIFLDMQHREYWYTEYLRWFFLLSDIPMGNYAKRAAVLVTVAGVIWFLVLAAAGRARGEPLPLPTRLAGWSLIAGFLLLWLTPSKWTHHFGALAGVGPAFLTLLLVALVPLGRRALGGDRMPVAVLAGAAGSMLIAFLLAGRGHNSWPYAWMYGFPDPNSAPDSGPFVFSSPASWLIVLGGCVALGWVWTLLPRAEAERGDRRGSAVLRGLALFVVAGLALNIAYLLGSFTLAARNTADSWSLWAADSTDPAASRCTAADAVSVFDPYAAIELPEIDGTGSATAGSGPAGSATAGSGQAGSGPAGAAPTGPGTAGAAPAGAAPAGETGQADEDAATAGVTGQADQDADESSGFERAGGYYLGNQPPVPLGTGAATTIWGSLLPVDGRTPDRNVAEMRSPWFGLPAGLEPDQEVAVLVAGSPGEGNSLRAEYLDVDAPGADPYERDTDRPARPGRVAEQPGLTTVALDDGGREPRWRSVTLDPPAEAELVRLHAVDNSAGPGGWLAFGAPAVQQLVPLRELLDTRLPAGPVALGWQIAFQYPCLRQPVIRDGITEAPVAAVLWAGSPFAGTRDATWQAFRGGIHGQVLRSRSVLQLTARVRDVPAERRLEVLVLDTPLARDAYRVSTDQRRSNGWAEFHPSPTRTLNDLERCVQTAAATGTSAAECTAGPIP